MRKFIPYAKQSLDEEDLQAVSAILRSDWLTQGPTIAKFESTLASFCDARFAVAVNSATSALHLACLALGIKEGDVVWTSPNTFVASANCALYCGAKVSFVDIDERTYNFSPLFFAEKLEQAKKAKQLPKAIVVTHFAGQSCDMEAIYALAAPYDIAIIEDASHALGGEYLKTAVGSCRYSDITVFSFHAIKNLTTGEGGMIVTQSETLFRSVERLRTHGITRNAEEMVSEKEGEWFYEQIALGFNYRMTDIQAALGLSQLKRLPAFIAKRRMLAENYHRQLASLPLLLPYCAPDRVSATHLYPVLLDDTKTAITRKGLFEALRHSHIGVNVHYIPVHWHPYYQRMGFQKGDYPVAESYYRRALTLPLYYDLSEDDQRYIVDTLTHFLA